MKTFVSTRFNAHVTGWSECSSDHKALMGKVLFHHDSHVTKDDQTSFALRLLYDSWK